MHRAPVATTSLNFFPSRTHCGSSISAYSLRGVLRSGAGGSDPRTVDREAAASRWSISSGPPPTAPIYPEAPLRNGLRTPPSDKMNSAVSYPQQYHTYSSRNDDLYSSSLSAHPAAAIPSYAAPIAPIAGSKVSALASVGGLTAPAYSQRHSPQSTTSTATIRSDDAERRKSIIQPNLQIPASINGSGGSLGEFAAQITCFFWFESTSTLRRAEQCASGSSPVKRLLPDAVPTISFRKWVVTILSTTQVTPNVILLALLFIYRLKTLNSTVKGKAGSEYRLLTVALMLGNKFLDDNTYTNKTWAEVSGISVSEIHVMEVEFLSNMRYSLLASAEQWAEWQRKLGKFWDYFEMAARATPALPSPIAATRPTVLPSPPASLDVPPPVLTTYPPNSAPYNYNQPWPAYAQGLSAPIPLPSMPDLVPELNLQPAPKKRGYEETVDEPPAKRVSRAAAPQMAPHTQVPIPRQSLPRLPVPNLSLTTTPTNGYHVPPSVPLLPPLVGGRAMSTVYPTSQGWPAHSQASFTSNISASSGSQTMGSSSTYSTPSRRQSPRSLVGPRSMNSSPISATFPHHNINSPSFFLQQRSSPYKPVRPPNTLLYPPPSSSMHNYSTNIDQMHYQPLGKRNDYRSGIVPDYVSHPVYHGWTGLPQPNFHS